MARAKKRRAPSGLGSVYQRLKGRQAGMWVATLEAGFAPDGKRARRTFAALTQEEAIAKRARFASQLMDGSQTLRPAAREYTVAEWLDYWLENKVAAECERTTIELYRWAADRHIAPYLGHIRLRDLETEQVEIWLKMLERNGVGARTRQSALTRLRTALNFALERRRQSGVTFNAAQFAPMPSAPRKKVPPPNIEHARALLSAAAGDRLEGVVSIGLAIGLRRGEIIGLRWEDIDFEQRVIHVRRRVSRVKGALLVRAGVKMDPEREDLVSLPQTTIRALKAHRLRQLAERLHAGDKWKGPEPTIDGKPAGYVFTSTVGTVLEPRNVTRSFYAMRSRAGLDEKTFHQLRHDCASLLLAQGVPMYAVSKILRHSSPRVTADYYAHLTAEVERAAADKMDDVLGPLMGADAG